MLGLDVGDARIGVAISDPLGMFAQPLVSLERKNELAVSEVVKLVEEHAVSIVVIGLPLELNGNEGEQAKKVKTFAAKLKGGLEQSPANQTNLFFWDERLTTVQAERVIAGSGLKNRARREALDRISAAIILESFLHSRQHLAPELEPQE